MTTNLHDFDRILISTSGGKDSQTMLHEVMVLAKEQNYPSDQITAVHADLGQVEWEGTSELAELQVQLYGIEFVKIHRELGDLLDQVEQRGMWPSNTARFCTSDQKRGQIDKVVTMLGKRFRAEGGEGTFRLLNCMGLRAQESTARSKKIAMQVNKRASNKSRTVTDWLPILDMTEEQVWASIKETGVPHHRAYDLGMPRLSCVFCIFAPKSALVLAGKHNRELLNKYAELEAKIDHKFTQSTSMAEVKELVESGAELEQSNEQWCM